MAKALVYLQDSDSELVVCGSLSLHEPRNALLKPALLHKPGIANTIQHNRMESIRRVH